MTDVALNLLPEKQACEKRAVLASQRCVRIVTLAFILQVALSYPLWFPNIRTYPSVPVFAFLPLEYSDWFTDGLSMTVLITLSMASITALWRQPMLLIGLACLSLLLLEDINRFQPWVYVYGILLFNIAWCRWREAPELQLAGLQFIVSMVYFWTGIHKLNAQFIADVYPWLIGVFPLTEWMKAYPFLGYGMGLTEIGVGILLLMVRTRRIGIFVGVLMHGIILMILIKAEWNTVVYPWNVAMMGLLVVLFWFPNKVPSLHLKRHRPTLFVLLLFGILPSLYLFKQLPVGLSLALYSGTDMECDLILKKGEAQTCIPTSIHDQFIPWGEDELLLSLDDWGMDDLNVPPYASNRSYREVARQFCTCAKAKGRIIFYYPNPWKDEDKTVYVNCPDLLQEFDD